MIDSHLYERIGDNYLASLSYQAAIDSYILALQSPSTSDKLYLNLRIADTYLALGENGTALVTYQDVYSRTANDYLKAEARRKIGDLQILAGNSDQAYLAYQEVVEAYPLSYDAYLSLVALLDTGVPVSDLDRGLINYFVKQYGLAVEAFVRYMRENTGSYADTAPYYLGLSYLNLGEYEKAIAAWQDVVDNHINDRNWANAFDEIAYSQDIFLNRPEQAIDTYLEYVDRSPLDARSPEFLYYAARVAERNYDLKTAARLWERIGTQFSTSSYAFDGLFQAGIARYRVGEHENAISLFQSALGVTGGPGDQAKAYFWIGKAYQKMNLTEAANDAWLQASTSDPTGYYSERAKDLLAGLPPFSPPAAYNLIFDPLTERSQAIEWMRTTFLISPEANLTDPSTLFSDPRMVRGSELWQLGQLEAARLEFESYRLAVQDDPVKTFLLADYLIEIGLYRS
ncbi:MAG: tetratricopeptide repeat protein, partial [Thermoleophilia bacterium]|nr:tetratricopeptide repeat protein [Thermoleophilia bacterium]